MDKRTLILAGGVLGLIGWKILGFGRRRPVPLNLRDAGYTDVSPEELNQAHLLDLNTAAIDQLHSLHLNQQAIERLIENRPYRSKLDLVSLMALSPAEYESIKDKVGIAHAAEPMKIA